MVPNEWLRPNSSVTIGGGNCEVAQSTRFRVHLVDLTERFDLSRQRSQAINMSKEKVISAK